MRNKFFIFVLQMGALGVRECILSVIKDLKDDSSSYGEEPESKCID